MPSLTKRPGSKKGVCCYTLPDGTRTQKSTGKTDEDEAMAICLAWEAASKRAREGAFTEAQARKVVSDIAERSGMGPVEFATAQQFFTDWIKSKELTKAKGTTVRYKHTVLRKLLAAASLLAFPDAAVVEPSIGRAISTGAQ